MKLAKKIWSHIIFTILTAVKPQQHIHSYIVLQLLHKNSTPGTNKVLSNREERWVFENRRRELGGNLLIKWWHMVRKRNGRRRRRWIPFIFIISSWPLLSIVIMEPRNLRKMSVQLIQSTGMHVWIHSCTGHSLSAASLHHWQASWCLALVTNAAIWAQIKMTDCSWVNVEWYYF